MAACTGVEISNLVADLLHCATPINLRDMRDVLGAHYDAVTAADKARKAEKVEKRRQECIEWDRNYDELEAAGKPLPDNAAHGP